MRIFHQGLKYDTPLSNMSYGKLLINDNEVENICNNKDNALNKKAS